MRNGEKPWLRQMAHDHEDVDDDDQTTILDGEENDTSLNLGALTRAKKIKKAKRAKVVQEIEPDQEMMAAEEN